MCNLADALGSLLSGSPHLAQLRRRRVVLKGDIPIGVDKRSMDTWVAPHYFRMDKSTGWQRGCLPP